MPGGSSLHKLLLKHRGESAKLQRPALTIPQILAWADAHHKRIGKWPTNRSDHIHGTKDETWHAVAACLYTGIRGLPRGLSLSKLLVKHRGKSVRSPRPVLTIHQILAWADAHRKRTGRWPNHRSGQVCEARDETWRAINGALQSGFRGLPGGSTLRRLLVEAREARFPPARPYLTIPQILAWADEHHKRTGKWPSVYSGRVCVAPDETWLGINRALRVGCRGLAAGNSLSRLLTERLGARTQQGRPRLTVKPILD